MSDGGEARRQSQAGTFAPTSPGREVLSSPSQYSCYLVMLVRQETVLGQKAAITVSCTEGYEINNLRSWKFLLFAISSLPPSLRYPFL